VRLVNWADEQGGGLMARSHRRAGQMSRAGFGAVRNGGESPLVLYRGRRELKAAPEAPYPGAASSRKPVLTALGQALAAKGGE
jgi:hypothetical protein